LSTIFRKVKHKGAKAQIFSFPLNCGQDLFLLNFNSALAPLRLIFYLVLFSSNPTFSQYIPVHPQTNNIYSFLDELPLNYNSVIKPLSRQEISILLTTLDTSSLTYRQKKELGFYLTDFNKEIYPNKNFPRRLDLFYYRDSSFSFTINPIFGGNVWVNKNGTEYHWWNGLEATSTLGKWGFFASLRDNHLSSQIYNPTYLDQQPPGAAFKVASDGKTDFEEIRGGVTYAWKTGHVGLMKDNFEWGSNYNGANIFSGHTPAFVHLDLQLKPVRWFEFNYTHGWLNSMVVDSSQTLTLSNGYGTTSRQYYHSKFMAANMFSFFPVPKLSLSFGNSIIYDYDQVHPVYLIPVMFYKAVDHSLTFGLENMNSQMFFDISSKNINHLHLYTTLFLDELAIKRITIKDEHNFASLKGGFRVNNLIPDFFGGMEYTITNALTFKHYVPTTTFESNLYNLGHYLTDNVKELYINLGWKPIRNMVVQLSFNDIRKGPDHTALGTMTRDKITPFVPVVYTSQSFEMKASWQVINDLYINLGFIHKKVLGDEDALITFSPEFWWGETNTLNFGVNFGF
jgi:hypothetical protein